MKIFPCAAVAVCPARGEGAVPCGDSFVQAMVPGAISIFHAYCELRT